MEKSSKLGKSAMFNIVLFGFMGQVAWAVENNFFNTFLFEEIGGNTSQISTMVAASSIVAVITTLFMGTLSDKLNRRKIFICGGYIVWGITVMSFAFISRENIGGIFGIEDFAATLVPTVTTVIIMDCVMTFMGSTSNDASFNAWITDITSTSNRAKTESILALLPIFALVIVTAVFGALKGTIGYSACFIGLGVLVTLCGIIGLFTIKDSRSGVKTDESYFKNLFYGFRPSVVKSHKGLYLSLACVGVFSIASQIFFPYLFIYVEHQIGFDSVSNVTLPMPLLIVIGVAVIVGLVVGIIKLGGLMDKKGKASFAFPAVVLFVVGLTLVYFAHDIVLFAIFALIAMAGYGLLMILLNAAVRDFTPEDKVGLFQGVRMIFAVMLPMIIGPRVGSAVTDAFATKTYVVYDVATKVPPQHIFLAAAATGIFIIIPLIFLKKEWKRIEQLSTDGN